MVEISNWNLQFTQLLKSQLLFWAIQLQFDHSHHFGALRLCLMVDNEAIRLCRRILDTERPTYTNLNRLIGQIVSSLVSLRFDGALNVDLTEFQTNLVPIPTYPLTHLQHLHQLSQLRKLTMIIYCLWDHKCLLWTPANQMLDVILVMASTWLVACSTVEMLSQRMSMQLSLPSKTKRTIQFVVGAPTGFKVGINYHHQLLSQEVILAKVQRAV